MKGIAKILMFSLLFFACRGDGEVLNTAELKQEFENYWWEAVDKSLTDSFSLDELTCFAKRRKSILLFRWRSLVSCSV